MEERKIAEAQIESFCQYLIPVNFFYTTPGGICRPQWTGASLYPGTGAGKRNG